MIKCGFCSYEFESDEIEIFKAADYDDLSEEFGALDGIEICQDCLDIITE